jgi:hypothetical protein
MKGGIEALAEFIEVLRAACVRPDQKGLGVRGLWLVNLLGSLTYNLTASALRIGLTALTARELARCEADKSIMSKVVTYRLTVQLGVSLVNGSITTLICEFFVKQSTWDE